MSSPKIDPDRLAAELEADADVVYHLRENGDVASVIRPVDVRFVGQKAKLAKLGLELSSNGWRFIQIVDLGDGESALDVRRDQTTEPASLRELTETALRIEITAGVEYDGWGTEAQS
jgi:hypothetical protein